MVRLIKRYGSRKLYDTEESRYVGLDELAGFVRAGQEVRVVDNESGDDVTAPTLAQVILEEGRSGRRRVPSEVLHELIRSGGRTLSGGVEQVQRGVERAIESSLRRLAPVEQARFEVDRLHARLQDLERVLEEMDTADETDDLDGSERAAPSSKESPMPKASRPVKTRKQARSLER
jgi:polyhydroxyalkanoate synthesis repressor PhaR